MRSAAIVTLSGNSEDESMTARIKMAHEQDPSAYMYLFMCNHRQLGLPYHAAGAVVGEFRGLSLLLLCRETWSLWRQRTTENIETCTL